MTKEEPACFENQKTEEGLKREITLWGFSAGIINTIVGAGIFVLPAMVAQKMGASSILAYIACGILVAMIMLCFAELGSRINHSGGPYAFIQTAFGTYAGFITSIIFMLAMLASDAAILNAIADILSTFFPVFSDGWFRSFFFLVLLTFLTLLNIRGAKQGIGLVKFFTFAKLVPLVLFILFGFRYVETQNLVWKTIPDLQNLGETSLLLFFAFLGCESALPICGEVKNPKKNIPKAIFISITVVLLLYMLIQFTAQGILGDALPLFTENPLGEVGKVIFGPIGLTIFTFVGLISILGSLSGAICTCPRVLFAASRDNVIPVKLLKKVHPKFATPFISILVYAGLAFILAISGGFKQLAIFATAGILLVYFGAVLSLIKLRKTQTKEKGLFMIPGGSTIPVISAMIILWLLSNLKKEEILWLAALWIVLSLIFLGIKRMSKKSPQN